MAIINGIESGTGGVWFAKQTAIGTPASQVGAFATRYYDGGLRVAKTLGSEDYADGNRWASPTTYVDMLGGDVGTLTLQADYQTLGLLFAHLMPVDTLTGTTPNFTHTFGAGTATPVPITIWQTVGQTVGPLRQQYSDCYITACKLVCSQQQNVMHAELTVLSLTPGVTVAAVPSTVVDVNQPVLWQEVAGALSVGGSVTGSYTGFELDINTGAASIWTDNVTPGSLSYGKGTLMMTLNAIVTSETLATYNTTVYGSATPAAGTAPTAVVPSSAVAVTFAKSATRSVSFTAPNIPFATDQMTIAPHRDGTQIDISFTGNLLRSAGALLTTVIKSDAATAF